MKKYKMIVNKKVSSYTFEAEDKAEAQRKADELIKDYNNVTKEIHDYILVEKREGEDIFLERCLDDVELKLKIQKGIQEYFKHSYYKGFMENRQLAFYEPVDESLKKLLKRNKRIEVMMYVLTVILGIGIVMFFVYLKVLLGG